MEGRREGRRTREGPPDTQKTERPKGTQREGAAARASAEESFSRTPPLPALRGPALPRAPRGPERPGASPQELSPMGRVGPAPSRADWPPPRWPRLINKFPGNRRPDPEPASAPGNSACAAAPPRARPRARELAFWGGAGGARGRARPARAPGALRGQPRSQPARSPCPAADLRRGWRGGPGSAWPRLLT